MINWILRILGVTPSDEVEFIQQKLAYVQAKADCLQKHIDRAVSYPSSQAETLAEYAGQIATYQEIIKQLERKKNIKSLNESLKKEVVNHGK